MIKAQIPTPINEPIKQYAPNSPERDDLKKALAKLKSEPFDIPLIIGGKEVRTGNTVEIRSPHKHDQLLGVYHLAGKIEVEAAIASAASAKAEWESLPWEERASVFLKAADLLAGPWRQLLNGATMLGQSKTIYQAEIDSACELIDFWRFNVKFYQKILEDQPISSPGIYNRTEYRALEGFVFAITPFNFTAIGGNLPTTPALVGNTVLWKPSAHAVLSNYLVMQVLMEAGLPAGVINFVPGKASAIASHLLTHPELAGVHFTGSTKVFHNIWATVSQALPTMKTYPRLVGETGGKDFIFAHNSANVDALVVAALRGSFEYQGQKCSAASRMYIPQSIWSDFKEKYVAEVAKIKMGDVENLENFMGAVIHRESFDDITGYIDRAKKDADAEIITGGGYDDANGFFIEPTTIVVKDPAYATMCDELFGPVLTIYVYDDADLDATLDLCDSTSPYGLTGAIFAQDRGVISMMADRLRHSAGNFYINDKPTGAVVGQQPFGGARASGTNDKAGSALNLLRWLSARSIKENFNPPTGWRYPSMD